jgi:glc operon protein GlcG
MRPNFTGAIFAIPVLLCGAALAQDTQPTANPLDVIPEKMPFNTPYGAPISLARAQAAIAAATEAAEKRGWAVNVAVVDSGANLVAFARMDGAQLGSIAVSEHKARAAVKFRRPTKTFEENIQKNDYKYQLTIDDVIASRGGIPLIDDGKLIGAIGCSGATGSQDEAACMVGAATNNKSRAIIPARSEHGAPQGARSKPHPPR